MALTQLLAAAVAVLSAVGLALGIGWIYPPAGVIALSLEGLAASYVIAYLDRRRGEVPRRPAARNR